MPHSAFPALRRRENPDTRREALIRATQDLIAEYGFQAATIRNIAKHANVSSGLVRHYFATKEDLLEASLYALLNQLGAQSGDVLALAGQHPPERLAVFVAAALRDPLLNPYIIKLWLSYLPHLNHQPHLKRTHDAAAASYQAKLHQLLSDLNPNLSPAELLYQTRACNNLIRGLRLESAFFTPNLELGAEIRICLRAVSAIIGVDLSQYHDRIPELRAVPNER